MNKQKTGENVECFGILFSGLTRKIKRNFECTRADNFTHLCRHFLINFPTRLRKISNRSNDKSNKVPAKYYLPPNSRAEFKYFKKLGTFTDEIKIHKRIGPLNQYVPLFRSESNN